MKSFKAKVTIELEAVIYLKNENIEESTKAYYNDLVDLIREESEDRIESIKIENKDFILENNVTFKFKK